MTANTKTAVPAHVRIAIARAIWAVRREEEDRCDMELENMGATHSVWAEADAVLAALPAALQSLAPVPSEAAAEGDMFEPALHQVTSAVIVQQPLPIPRHFALVHRNDLLTLRHEVLHRRAYFNMLRRASGMDPQLVPDRDPAKPDTEQGLYAKFHVFRTDGKDAPGGPKAGAEYLVLDITHDPYAIPAARAYAEACSVTHKELAADIVTMLPA